MPLKRTHILSYKPISTISWNLQRKKGGRPRRTSAREFYGGDEGIRTPGLCLAKAALSQLSYVPGNGAVAIVAPRAPLVNVDTKSRPLRCVNEPTSQKVGVPIARSGFPSNGESPY